MARCDVCGNDYDKAFSITQADGTISTFDSFECAIHALAPVCEHCGVKVVGHGVEADGTFFCCASCARMHGDPQSASELVDHAGRAPDEG